MYVLVCCLHLETEKDSESAVNDELLSAASVRRVNQQPTKKQLRDCNRHEFFHCIYFLLFCSNKSFMLRYRPITQYVLLV